MTERLLRGDHEYAPDMDRDPSSSASTAQAASDALVVFGITGDLARKQIFPALYGMRRSGTLTVPVIGVASSDWGIEQLRAHATESIRADGQGKGAAVDTAVLDRRGGFYESAGCLRDVVQNHLFQIVALLAMEPPASRDFEAVHRHKADVFAAMRPLQPEDMVRGQYTGYRDEPQVAKDSDVETYCALRLHVDSWRWGGVPWYLRSGKCLPATACEVVVRLKAPPQNLFADAAVDEDANCLRFHLSPHSTIALGARVKRAGKEFAGDQREFSFLEEEPGEQAPYERLLTDAMNGDGALFTREGAIEAAWAVVEPVLADHPPVLPYEPGSAGPLAANHFIAADGSWHNPEAAC